MQAQIANKKRVEKPTVNVEFAVGDRVSHNIFGEELYLQPQKCQMIQCLRLHSIAKVLRKSWRTLQKSKKYKIYSLHHIGEGYFVINCVIYTNFEIIIDKLKQTAYIIIKIN